MLECSLQVIHQNCVPAYYAPSSKPSIPQHVRAGGPKKGVAGCRETNVSRRTATQA